MYIAAFFAGLALFFGSHLYSVFRPRGAGTRPLGMAEGPYKGLYSLVSLAGFVLLVWGYGNLKPWISVWIPPPWTRHLALGLMPIATILIVAAYVPTGYIRKAVGHPMLIAVTIWAAAHLAANGDLGSMVLFGSFLVFALVDRFAVRARGDRGSAKPANILGDMIAVAVGGALYGIIVYYLHPVLFGVEALPV